MCGGGSLSFSRYTKGHAPQSSSSDGQGEVDGLVCVPTDAGVSMRN